MLFIEHSLLCEALSFPCMIAIKLHNRHKGPILLSHCTDEEIEGQKSVTGLKSHKVG